MTTRQPGWLAALGTALTATVVALLVQTAIRGVWQLRSLPERVMEWLLLFVPLDLFEAGLARFGANAKDIALAGLILGMAALLVLVGTLAVRFGRSSWWLLGLGLLLWLVTMAVVMPVTGAGFFATGLFVSPLLTTTGYLLVFLAYGTTLVLGHLLFWWLPSAARAARPPRPETAPAGTDRRALITGLLGGIVALGVARVAAQGGSLASSSLPLATLPTPPPPTAAPPATAAADEPATPPPAPTDAPAATDQPAAGGVTPAPTVAAAPPTATPVPALPTPPPARQLARDKDGALTAAGRPKGTLAPQITPTEDFYVVTKNAVADPVVDAATWRLAIDGEVVRPVQIDYATLRGLPSVTVVKTLECISNLTSQCSLTSFGCDLISTAAWTGVPLAVLVDLAGGLKPRVEGFAILSVDEFSAGLPVEVAMDPGTLVAYEMNGDVLPREHGYPARLLVPGRYGMKDPKWLAAIRPMTREYAGWYEQRNWNKDGIVKTMARIDVPVDGATLPAGSQRVAGVAYAGDRGIDKVELSADGGDSWQPTRLLEPPPAADVFVRWETTISLAAGESATLVVRATDGRGEVQTEQFSLPQPDGATGRDTIEVHAA
jgi:DMSO/TMAO reductase YedYZ molybdopterin-dependent catalytic subunit